MARAKSNDEIAQATKDFLFCRFDPDDLEAQLAMSFILASEKKGRRVKVGSADGT